MKPRLGVYIHIPFCASKCGYCDFYSLAGCDKQMPVYHKALIDHILEASPGIRNYEVDSVYFGGGTPSYYGAERLLELFDILKLNGNVRTDAEVTVECNPDSMDYKELLALREEGVNRLSVGIQAADDSLLKLLSRRHSWAQAQAAYHDARRAGFDNISVDLMYGLPTQTARDWADTLARVCELHPEHISCYALKLEEGTPMYEEYLNSPVLPDDDAQADMYSYAAQMLERYGYRQYEVSNFAAPGFESRHNLKYWRLDDYMGFGPGAHSSVGSLRYSFVRDLRQYTYGVARKVSIRRSTRWSARWNTSCSPCEPVEAWRSGNTASAPSRTGSPSSGCSGLSSRRAGPCVRRTAAGTSRFPATSSPTASSASSWRPRLPPGLTTHRGCCGRTAPRRS